MSGSRLLLTDFATKIAGITTPIDPTIYVSNCYDPAYVTKYLKIWPAVWIIGQKSLPRDQGQGLSNFVRQNMNTQILVQCHVQRNPPAAITTAASESRLKVLEDAVTKALFGWMPSGATLPLAISSIVDGPAFESTIALDMIFITQTTYTGS